MIEKCTTNRKCKIITVEENGIKFIIENEKSLEINQIKVDGCLIAKNDEKCDWAFRIPESNKVLFVELKGGDVKKAISQLEATLKKTKDYFDKDKKECFIVSRRVPSLNHEIRLAKIKFQKNYSSSLNVKNVVFKYQA